MKPAWRRVLAILFVGAALGFTAVLLADRWAAFRALRRQVEGFDWALHPGWLAAALFLATLNLGWMGAAWVHLYRSGGGRLSYERGVRIWLVTNLGRYIPGKIWQLSGLAVHLRQSGGSGALALSSALGFQLVTLLTGMGLGAVLLGRDVRVLGLGSWTLPALLAVVFVALLHPAVLDRLTAWMARVMGEDQEIEAPGGRPLWEAAGALLAAWLLYGLSFWCFLRGLTPATASDPWTSTGIFAASYVAGYVVLIAPGGIVVREGAMTALLTALTPLSAPVSAAVAVLARVWVTLSELCAVGTAALGSALGKHGTPADGGGG